MGSDAFIWPFDGDPFSRRQAARRSRRGWRSQVWVGRAGRGEGARLEDARGGRGAAAAFLPPIAPARRTGVCGITPCRTHGWHVGRSTGVCAMCGAGTRSPCVRGGVGELRWEEGGKGED